jgi:beta-lactamase regulating signal transducer with metallopeptidase domain
LTTNQLNTSFFVLLAWVVVVTIALFILIVVTYRRWRRRGALWAAQSGSCSNLSECSESPMPQTTHDRAKSNDRFTGSAATGNEQLTQVHIETSAMSDHV